MSNVIAFRRRRPRPATMLRADVPPFDPSNPDHLRAWEALYDLGYRALHSPTFRALDLCEQEGRGDA